MRSLILISVLVACGGGGGVDLGDYDPRCVQTCTDDPPTLDGAYDVCNSASRESCLELCEARIAGQVSLCQSCLLEDSYYGTGDGDGGFANCANGQCTIQGRVGSCTYPMNDNTARDNCLRQVYPRREVACDVDFQPVTACADVCTM